MQTLMLQQVFQTWETTAWHASILVPKPVLMDPLGDDREEVLSGVEHVRHHDLVRGALTVTLIAKFMIML